MKKIKYNKATIEDIEYAFFLDGQRKDRQKLEVLFSLKPSIHKTIKIYELSEIKYINDQIVVLRGIGNMLHRVGTDSHIKPIRFRIKYNHITKKVIGFRHYPINSVE